ncbi:MAG: hypothetical protein HY735_06905 [Verrucomicrobia bacterium]|nr:hypothetical protein [Verrucomicrobiota bacterium]
MKTHRTQPEQIPLEAVAAVRHDIERQFPVLSSRQPRSFRLALNEAEALAWQTPYPYLVFPLLALEKVRAIAAWHERQEALRRQGPVLAFPA